METANVIIKIVGLIIICIGTVMVYDARKITIKWFSFSDRNESTKILKIVGFIVAIIGGLIIMLNNI